MSDFPRDIREKAEWIMRVANCASHFGYDAALKRCCEALMAEREASRVKERDRIYARVTARVVTWLHARAHTMDDPKAKAVLNLAADDFGRANGSNEASPEARA
jgi:hypothetical protein